MNFNFNHIVKLLPNKLTYKLHKFTSSLKMAKNLNRNMWEKSLIKSLCDEVILNSVYVTGFAWRLYNIKFVEGNF